MKFRDFRRFAGILLLLCLGASPARADWRRAESPHFIVYSTEAEATLRQRVLQLEDYRLLLRTMTTATTTATDEQKLNIYVVNHADLRTVRRVEPEVAGFYTATPDGIAAFVAANELNGNEVLFHEYAHHFMLQFAATAYPPWYVEGFAEYLMTADLRPGRIEMGRASAERLGQFASGTWEPIADILFYDGRSNEDVFAFYAESWLAVHYFQSTPERHAALRRYLAAVARGGDPRAAFQSEIGISPVQLDVELQSYIRRASIPTVRISHAIPPPPAIVVTAMPRSADDLMLYEATLRIGVPADYCPGHLRRVRAAADHYPGDRLARRVLAQYELECGDAAAADRLLDGLLAETPSQAELLYLKAMLHLRAAHDDRSGAEMRLARQLFGRAHAADESHYPTLFRYAQSMEGEPGYVSENTENLLLLALQIAPQVDQIRLAAARLLMLREKYGDAETLLGPLAANVHSGELAQLARALIDRAHRHLPPEDPAPATAAPGAAPRPGPH